MLSFNYKGISLVLLVIFHGFCDKLKRDMAVWLSSKFKPSLYVLFFCGVNNKHFEININKKWMYEWLRDLYKIIMLLEFKFCILTARWNLHYIQCGSHQIYSIAAFVPCLKGFRHTLLLLTYNEYYKIELTSIQLTLYLPFSSNNLRIVG